MVNSSDAKSSIDLHKFCVPSVKSSSDNMVTLVPSRFQTPWRLAASRFPSSSIPNPRPENEPCDVELGLSFMLYVMKTRPYFPAIPETVSVPPSSVSSTFSNLPFTVKVSSGNWISVFTSASAQPESMSVVKVVSIHFI